jgi:hypothetical protein
MTGGSKPFLADEERGFPSTEEEDEEEQEEEAEEEEENESSDTI